MWWDHLFSKKKNKAAKRTGTTEGAKFEKAGEWVGNTSL